MAKTNLANFHREWNERHDECHMTIWISVDQVTGTRASFQIVNHQWLPGEERTVLARYTSEDRDPSEDAMRGVLQQLLQADFNRMVLEQALANPDA